jgi:hypothetical protein
VRQTETECPFCRASLSLGHVPPHALPLTRLGRAATFAFGATLVAGAATLVGCSDNEEGKKGGGGGTGGNPSAGQHTGGSAQPVYGAPAAGTGPDTTGGTPGTGGTVSDGGGAMALYGAVPAGGTENTGGTGGGVPLYGAAPAD